MCRCFVDWIAVKYSIQYIRNDVGLTAILNASGAILFLVGVLFITMFAGYNLSNKGLINDRKEVTSATSNTATKPKIQQSYSTPTTAPSDRH